jgi:hypothetical protein
MTRHVAMLAMLVMFLANLLSFAQDSPAKKSPQTSSNDVTVVIDYGDGVQKHFTKIPWKQGLTVFDAMKAAQEHPRGIRFEFKGSGATAMLTKIDDLANEGRGRNWLYQVDGKKADDSFGIHPLGSRSSVLWKFDHYR